MATPEPSAASSDAAAVGSGVSRSWFSSPPTGNSRDKLVTLAEPVAASFKLGTAKVGSLGCLASRRSGT